MLIRTPLLPMVFTCAALAAGPGHATTIDEIVVTSERRAQSSREVAASISALDGARIAAVNPRHVHEILNRVPGVWLSRCSGQESLPAIRSPVLTGAGACGAVLTREDGIPTRPAGFCNVNQMFELLTEQAASIEVLRGPGTVLYGSNALHGLVNVLIPEPGGRVARASKSARTTTTACRLTSRSQRAIEAPCRSCTPTMAASAPTPATGN
jgi:outer membrane cobalamin receptor